MSSGPKPLAGRVRSPAASGRPPPLTRANTTACVRCRQKKKRCDQKLPRCHLCELAGVECFGYDVAAGRQLPRSYIQSLEERVAYLESKLREKGLGNEDISFRPGDPAYQLQAATLESGPVGSRSDLAASPATHDAPGILANSTLHTFSQAEPRQDARFLGVRLTELLASRTTPRISPGCQSDQNNDVIECAPDIVNNMDTGPITLPTKEAALNLTKEYFQCSNLGMPLLHEPTLTRKLALVYSMPHTINLAESHRSTEARIALFFVFEVFAVALLSMQKRNASRFPTWLGERHHQLAIRALIEAGLPNDVEGVQALLLVGQFYYFHPTLWVVWDTVSAAFRLAVELGLHQDPPSGKLDALILDTRRRTFWVAYSMERNISIAKSIPSYLLDGAIHVEFPSEIDDRFIASTGITTSDARVSGSKLVSLHLFRYRQIQSEMKTALFEKPPPPYAPFVFEEWQQEMRNRIDKWYKAIPTIEKLNARDRVVIETFNLTYNSAIFYLYRSSPNNPTPSGQQWVDTAQAATNMIRLYRRYFLEKKLNIYWQAIENLYSAGTTLILGYTIMPQVRESITFQPLESIIHTCSSVLWGMVERFPAFQAKRDAFDAAALTLLPDQTTATPLGHRTEESPVQGDTHSNAYGLGRVAAESFGASAREADHHPLSGENLTTEDPAAVTAAGPKSGLPSHFTAFEINSELDLNAPGFSSSVTDFDDLAMVWDAPVDLGGCFTPTWI